MGERVLCEYLPKEGLLRMCPLSLVFKANSDDFDRYFLYHIALDLKKK